MVYTEYRWGNSIFEDPTRPGYADIDRLRNNINVDNSGSAGFKSRWANLDVAMHDRHNAYPTFMPTYSAPNKASETYPTNNDAASELAVALLKYRYNDFNRPGTYEIMNEPHWSVWNDQRFADLHTDVLQKAKAEGLTTDIGGPCLSVGWYYRQNYTNLNNLYNFINNTQCSLDFYSFHIYDFLQWDATASDFRGRVSTGLPLEGVMDALQNKTMIDYNKEIPIVISEHGGYLSNNAADGFVIPDQLATQLLGGGSGFNYEMRKRSVGSRIMTRSVISNTMTFMNNPHVIRKAVPFILLSTANWNPRYYSALIVAENFTNGNTWVESEMVNFYKLFANVKGKRVLSSCEDPDIQYQTFLDGEDLFVVLNNLGAKQENINLDLTNTEYTSIEIKRHGQDDDFTPYFTVETPSDLNGLELKGRESMVIKLSYPEVPETTKSIDVVPYYSNIANKTFSTNETVNYAINVPEYSDLEHATLRVGVGRQELNTDRDLKVVFNGTEIDVPMEDVADYLEDSNGYGSVKIMKIDPSLVKENNTIAVSFPDGKAGGIGAVVLRVGLPTTTLSTDTFNNTINSAVLYPNPLRLEDSNTLTLDLNKSYESIEYTLYDLNGRNILTDKQVHKETLKITVPVAISKGIYFLRFQTEKGAFFRKLIIK